MYRREFCASLGVAAVGSAAGQDHATPGVVARRTYDDVSVTDLTAAHDAGLALVGCTADSAGLRVTETDAAGRIRDSRRLAPPDGIDGSRGVPGIARTADGYAVSSGGWLGVLAPDLTVEAKTAHPEWSGLGKAEAAAAGPGVVVAHEYDAPNHVSVTVTGYDADGTHQWHRHYGSEQSRTLGFLVSAPDGVVVGGRNAAVGGLWTAGLAPDGRGRWSSTNTSVATRNDPAAAFDDGLLVFDGTTLTKLDDSRSVVWEHSYGSFGDSPPRLLSLPDGGTLAGAGTTVGAFGPDGRRRWVRAYDVADAGRLGGLLAVGDGEYVAVGPGSDAASGWLLRLSSAVTPTASPTSGATTTGSPTAADGPTATGGPTATTSRTAPDTVISLRGFGPVAAVAALAGMTVWLRRRVDS